MLPTIVTILLVFQTIFLMSTGILAFNIARTHFIPSRPWYLLTFAMAIHVSEKIFSLVYLADIRNASIAVGGNSILLIHCIRTIVFTLLFITVAELYSYMRIKAQP